MLDQILFNQSTARNMDNVKFSNAQQAKTTSLMMTLKVETCERNICDNDYLLLTVLSVTPNNAHSIYCTEYGLR
jgi:hypothetical protein